MFTLFESGVFRPVALRPLRGIGLRPLRGIGFLEPLKLLIDLDSASVCNFFLQTPPLVFLIFFCVCSLSL